VHLQRPRKLGAKYTGQDIAADEHLQPALDFDYEGKRDRWNGYDPAAYRHVVDDYQKIEEAKRQLKAQKMEAALVEGSVDESVAKVCFLFFCYSLLATSNTLMWMIRECQLSAGVVITGGGVYNTTAAWLSLKVYTLQWPKSEQNLSDELGELLQCQCHDVALQMIWLLLLCYLY